MDSVPESTHPFAQERLDVIDESFSRPKDEKIDTAADGHGRKDVKQTAQSVPGVR